MHNLSDARIAEIAASGKPPYPTLYEARAMADELLKLRKKLAEKPSDPLTAGDGVTLHTYLSERFNGNKTRMGEYLQINRGTIKTWMEIDPLGHYHRVIGDQFMCATLARSRLEGAE